ncbi:hypothetical protein D2T29_22700 [Sinirhodobacter populi]|uniref:MFS transporter n=1 Tax=Paenirhodobacter populi TaxID=2306993 RepID=A0A443IR83_9RHOB|nr:hypothetical protein [Sinirhodobacter populi]RWR09180.1 hypothetical protein D2T33_14370 [Sinirhodobacter populi]RWR24270.1 hypothetical protein D2T29_22700 [Sinirhodobacter populi]RWR25690.1 hypothetical protein D2T31_21625 [Sinirhodobacter populi]
MLPTLRRFLMAQCEAVAGSRDFSKEPCLAEALLLNLSRNIGLILGASAMGAVFTLGTGTSDLPHASTSAVAAGLRLTFLLAGWLLVFAIFIVFASQLKRK